MESYQSDVLWHSHLVVDHFQLICDAPVPDLLHVRRFKLLPEIRIALQNLNNLLQVSEIKQKTFLRLTIIL